MHLFDRIQQDLSGGPTEIFVSFDELFEEFPGSKPDLFRPFDPVDLENIPDAAMAAGLHPFSKRLGEGGIWLKLK